MSERLKRLKWVFWGVVTGLLIIGVLGYVHWQIHGLGIVTIRSQTQVQERKMEQIETITQKIVFEECER